MRILTALLAFIALPAQATFLPEADLRRAESSLTEGTPNITEPEFRAIVAQIQNSYQAVAKKHGGNLAISGDWKSETLNAGASQMFGSWKVVISGALARRPELTPDGTALILCHELGHHLGGYSFHPAGHPFEGVWAANEGQADYFATQVCARKIWAPEKEKNAGYRANAPEFVRERCNTAWGNPDDQDLCYRVSAATESVTNTMAALMKKPAPKFETPDTAVVEKTLNAHPAVQCRMDTSFQGAICPVDYDESIIPGKKTTGGPFGVEAEKEAARVSCTAYSGQAFGRRPSCWFKANF